MRRHSTSDRMKAELPIAELVTIKRGGHMALMEHKQRFSRSCQRVLYCLLVIQTLVGAVLALI
jgi:hypothetical protein